MKLCEPFEVSSSYELNSKLHSFDSSVPPRDRGRKSEHTERWVACRFLCTIANSYLLSYPLRVELSDKPDLILMFERGEPQSIGIEITEAISQNAAKLQAELEQDDMVDLYHVPEHKYFDSRQDLETQRKIVRGEAPSPPIMGNAIEQNWYEAIFEIICKKSTKFEHLDFRCYPENWLLIYDNWSPSPPDSEVQAMTNELSHSLFANDWQQPFDRVFILGSEIMWEFREDMIPISYRVTTTGRLLSRCIRPLTTVKR